MVPPVASIELKFLQETVSLALSGSRLANLLWLPGMFYLSHLYLADEVSLPQVIPQKC